MNDTEVYMPVAGSISYEHERSVEEELELPIEEGQREKRRREAKAPYPQPESRPLGYDQLTVSSTAIGLRNVPKGASYALISVESAGIRWRDDGSSPTDGIGMPLASGSALEYDANLEAIKFIRSTATDAVINVAFYG